MALSFSNCLTQQGSGVNQMYGDCCCDIQCTVTTDIPALITDIVGSWEVNSFFFANSPKAYINGVLQTYPFFLPPNESFSLEMEICAAAAGNSDILKIEIFEGGSLLDAPKFDFESIDLSTSVSPTSFSFGNTVIGSTKTLGFQIQNPTTWCCYGYTITTSCAELVITPDVSNTLCPGENQSNFNLDWTPTDVGVLDCTITVTTDCQTYDFPVTGNAINPPSGGGTTPAKKNKVDQTTRVEACSPRTVNNRCNTARTMQNAIRQTARRIGRK
jgi:hypothetical protein